jgi:putative colanic acid biosynthesis glycosyltransferase
MRNVLHINSDLSSGGAAKSVRELSEIINLCSKEFNSYLVTGYSTVKDVKSTNREEVLLSNLCKYSNVIQTRLSGYDSLYYLFQNKKRLSELIKKSDIIHLHNLHGYYVDYEWLIYEINKYNKPIIWTIRDYWLITGKCCFPKTINYLKSCIDCNCLNEYPKSFFFNRSEELLKKKISLISSIKKIKFITLSINSLAKVSMTYLNKYSIDVIYNGFDISGTKFTPRLESGIYHILFLANDPDSPRKGLKYLIEAISLLNNKCNTKLHIVGNLIQDVTLKYELQKINYEHHGFISSIEDMENIYSLVHVYANPTQDETFGRTSIEALSRGIPVVVFDLPILKEVIGKVGYYAKMFDSASLYEKLFEVYNHIEAQELDIESYIEQANLYDKQRMLKNYEKQYTDLLNN